MGAGKPTCSSCGKRFTKVSSRNRHLRQCLHGLKPPPRRKACRACSTSKLRCGLEKPSCQRCLSRSIECTYSFVPQSAAPHTEPATHNVYPHRGKEVIEITDGPTGAPSLQQRWPTPDSFHAGDNIAGDAIHHAADEVLQHPQSPRPAESTLPPSTSITHLPDSSIPKIYGRDGTALRPATGGPFAGGIVSKQCAHTMVRMMKSWSRLMSEYTPTDKRLPPTIHPQQTESNGQLPTALANCVALTKMWASHDVGLGELVDSMVRAEITRLLDTKDKFSDELDLLAAGQSLVLLLVILLFGIKRDPVSVSSTPEAIDARSSANAKLVIEVWDLRETLMRTSFAQSRDEMLLEVDSSSPGGAGVSALTPSSSTPSSSRTRGDDGTSLSWTSWALTSATRRTIIALHNLELSWACLNDYPIMSCFGLYHLPLPEAGYLWRANSEMEWRRLYIVWRRKWYGDDDDRGRSDPQAGEGRGDGWSTEPRKTGPYLLTEYINIKPGEPLHDRAERWLAEADEFGVMLMSVVSAVYDT